MSGISVGKFGEDFAARLRDLNSEMHTTKSSMMDRGVGSDVHSSGKSFMDHMADSIREVDGLQKTSDKMATDLATGKAENIHEVMIANSEAQLAFNLMVQVRNKMLEAYQEVMRMPV